MPLLLSSTGYHPLTKVYKINMAKISIYTL